MVFCGPVAMGTRRYARVLDGEKQAFIFLFMTPFIHLSALGFVKTHAGNDEDLETKKSFTDTPRIPKKKKKKVEKTMLLSR